MEYELINDGGRTDLEYSVRQIRLDIDKYEFGRIIDSNYFRRHSKVEIINRECGEMQLRMRLEIPALWHKSVEIKYPLDWWQSFKERWFNKPLLKRYPVQYKKVTVKAVEFHPEIEWEPDHRNQMYVAVFNSNSNKENNDAK
jgi:hypothetical protein